jgi:type I restriction enzyme S subunit
LRTDLPEKSASDSWLYSPKFPKEWRTRDLHSVADWLNGMAFRNIQFSQSGLPVVKIAEIKNGVSGQTKFTDAVYDEPYRIKNGDMLFSWSGQPETSIDVFKWRGPEGWLNQHIFKVTALQETCTQDFLFYLLKYLKPHFIAIAKNKQTTGLGHVTKSDLKSMQVGIPEASIQAAIVQTLKPLDDKIDLNLKISRALERLAQALFHSWFIEFEPVYAKSKGEESFHSMSDSLFHSITSELVDSNLGPVPSGWFVKPLNETVEVNPTRRLSRNTIAPYIEMSQLPTEGHLPEGWVFREAGSGARFMNGDTLVARITPCLENGKTAFIDFLEEREVGWGSTEYIVLRPHPPIPELYAYLLARTSEFRSFAIQNMSGTSGRQRVPFDALSKFAVAVPPEPVLTAFGELVQPLIKRSTAALLESKKLAAMRDLLLQAFFRGELQPPTESLQ